MIARCRSAGVGRRRAPLSSVVFSSAVRRRCQRRSLALYRRDGRAKRRCDRSLPAPRRRALCRCARISSSITSASVVRSNCHAEVQFAVDVVLQRPSGGSERPSRSISVDDLALGRALEGGVHEGAVQMPADVAQVGLQDLADVHTRRHAQRVQHDVHRRSVRQEGHILLRQDLGDDALVAVASRHLIAFHDLTLLGDIDADQHVDAGGQFVGRQAQQLAVLHVAHARRPGACSSCRCVCHASPGT